MRAIPLSVLVLTVPEKVVAPEPATCVRFAARMEPKLAFAVWVMVRVPKRVLAPIGPEVVMLPVPLLRVKVWPPLTEPVIVMLPAPVLLLRVVAAIRVMGPAKPIDALLVRILPPMFTGPVPV